MKNVWSKKGSTYTQKEITNQVEKLPVGVYKVMEDPIYHFLYLDHIQESFPFPYKVYGVERNFIERVKKSYKNTKGNFGVLLNGVKGTGKTVTAEILCNEMNLPVIIVPRCYESLVSFLNDIQQDVILFIDEYEKVFDDHENALLSIMDGVFKTKYRLLFLLTTNETRIDPNLLQRPSRIRYVKMFDDLKLDVIMEVVDDMLIHKHHREATIKVISEMPIITMDLVKSVVEEVNIHDEDPNLFKDVFNIQPNRVDLYNVYKIKDGNKEIVNSFSTVYPAWISEDSIGDHFVVNGENIGRVKSIISRNELLIETRNRDTDEYEKDCVYLLEPSVRTHKAFSSAY